MAYKRHQMTLYVKDIQGFKDLREEVRNIWYNYYGVYLTKSDLLMSCMRFAKDGLLKGENLATESKPTVSEKYARTDS